jgi:septal ring factor EnvC (AmiA/AmiB activator)
MEARRAGSSIALAALALALARPASAGVREQAARALTERLATVDHTDAILAEKRGLRTRRLERRVRALYKLARAGDTRLWVDPGERGRAVRRRAAARRILGRELREIELLGREREQVARSRVRIVRALGELVRTPLPEPRSLARPVPGRAVAGFGTYRDREAGAELSRRGTELRSRPGAPVRAVAAGRVRYAGPVRGLGHGVIVEHPGPRGTRLISVTARLGELAVTLGDEVSRRQVLGRARGRRIHLEIRLPVGPAGFPVDPAPLLARPRPAR